MSEDRRRLKARLSGYWRMEGFAAVTVAPFAGWLVVKEGGRIDAGLLVAMAATTALLVIGAAYWRAALHRARGEPGLMRSLLPAAAALKLPMLLLVGAAAIAALLSAAGGRWAPGDVATCALAVLALLEWINYYAVQLQHFDHAADFKRLLTGRGFRRAHLGRDIDRMRARARAPQRQAANASSDTA